MVLAPRSTLSTAPRRSRRPALTPTLSLVRNTFRFAGFAVVQTSNAPAMDSIDEKLDALQMKIQHGG